jgi:hypothetical protein
VVGNGKLYGMVSPKCSALNITESTDTY